MVQEDWDPGITEGRSTDSDDNQGEDFCIGVWRYSSYLKEIDLGTSRCSDGIRGFWKQDLSNTIAALIKARAQKEEGMIESIFSSLFLYCSTNSRSGINGDTIMGIRKLVIWLDVGLENGLWRLIWLLSLQITKDRRIYYGFAFVPISLYYKVGLGAYLSYTIIITRFWFSFKIIKAKFVLVALVTMTQGHLLGCSEVTKTEEGMRKRLKISVPHFDNSALIKTFSKTLIGRCMNPEEQDMKALLGNLPKIWKVEDRVLGTDLGFGKFQFDFEREEDIETILKLQPFHFDYWMLAIGRWQEKTSQTYPSEIPFWVMFSGIPSQFRTEPTLRSIGDALGRLVEVDLDHKIVLVIVDGFKELCFETTINFKGGQFYEEEEVTVALRYEKLFGYCTLCASLCHTDEKCPLDKRNQAKADIRLGWSLWKVVEMDPQAGFHALS
ncbi:Zinc knuckle CX2CX4HX4C protein [Raphanus sativus]|nr:Zinc knuckle CX2CX4HX4C protein [Raphanus sativus]